MVYHDQKEKIVCILQEKKRLKEEKLKQEEKYMWALVDGVKEKVILEMLLYCNVLTIAKEGY